MFKIVMLFSIAMSTVLLAGNIEVKDAYVRAVPPNLPNSASFMTIINNGATAVDLTRADSTLADTLELHEHTMKNGMMVMAQVPKITIPAHGSVMLKPGGYHIMIIGLKKPIKPHDSVKMINLHFSDGETLTLKNVPVKSVMGGMKMKNMKMNGMKMNGMKSN
ncbi:copper chaperone PCu(A)C [Sulfurospirillum sp. 1612]|uniref:copper chaperone PCu(A)C n=1 Tax=Sulfurospirillum sp. 1612 TaxID=3094835 RepID=UPI002F9368F7